MVDAVNQLQNDLFLLTPLREGRLTVTLSTDVVGLISTHAPAGGATFLRPPSLIFQIPFLLTPLREGRRGIVG